MAKTTPIPPAVKADTLAEVEQFNAENNTRYEIYFRGRFAYLSRLNDNRKENSMFVSIAQLMGMSVSNHPDAANMDTLIGRLT